MKYDIDKRDKTEALIIIEQELDTSDRTCKCLMQLSANSGVWFEWWSKRDPS